MALGISLSSGEGHAFVTYSWMEHGALLGPEAVAIGSRMRESIVRPLQPPHTHTLGNCSTDDPAFADGERSELFVVIDGRHPQQMPGGLGACFVFLANLHNEFYGRRGWGKPIHIYAAVDPSIATAPQVHLGLSSRQ